MMDNKPLINMQWEQFVVLSKHERWTLYREWRKHYRKRDIARMLGCKDRSIYKMFGSDRIFKTLTFNHSTIYTYQSRQKHQKASNLAEKVVK